MNISHKDALVEKAGYHHGDLRSSLVAAALSLVEADGADACTLKAASKMAGVSVAAPYRHFPDKTALLDEVANVGFAEMNEKCIAARDVFPMGDVEGLIAMGQALVSFASSHPHLFRLMFDMRGKTPPDVDDGTEEGRVALDHPVRDEGFQCFLDTVSAVIAELGGPPEDLMKLAMPMWSMVHGAACLLIDNGFAMTAPDTVTDDVVATASRNFFLGYSADLKDKAARH